MGSLAGRCAEILVGQDGGTGYGSGLRLSTSLVVTAGHVVDGGGSVRLRLSGGAPDEIVVTGRTVWRGVRLDVALVELAPDVALDEVAPMAVGVVPDQADGRLPFTAIGFPRHQSWTGTDTATWRDSDQIDGVIPLGSSLKRGRLLLHRADGRRLEARDWSGFSGAGVVCEGSAVGVVVESAHSGGLEAARLAAVIGAYEPRAEAEREPEPSATAARELLASHGVVPAPLRGQQRHRPAYEALLRQYAARCAELTGRDRELAGLLDFATGPDPYLMIVAGPWAGKTSLVTRFATQSHNGLDTDLATPALELAVHTVLEDSDDSIAAGWEARAVASAAAELGHLDHTLRIAATVEPDRLDRVDILLDAARAVEADGGHRAADLALLIAQVTEEIEKSTDPSVAGWRTRVIHELISLHLRAGHADRALDLARRLARTDLTGRRLELRAYLLSNDIPSAISLTRGTALSRPAGSPIDPARSQELAAELIVELCEAGHEHLCRDITTRLVGTADLGVTPGSGLWARPWLTAACQATGLTEDFTRLLDTLRHAALVTGGGTGTESVPLEAVVRLRLWDRYRADARRLNDVLAEIVLTDMIKAMLDAGHLTEALPLIDDLPGDDAYSLALAAAVTSPPRVDLVRRSLARGFAEEVIAPLAALEPACLPEIAAQLGLIRPPAEQRTPRAAG